MAYLSLGVQLRLLGFMNMIHYDNYQEIQLANPLVTEGDGIMQRNYKTDNKRWKVMS